MVVSEHVTQLWPLASEGFGGMVEADKAKRNENEAESREEGRDLCACTVRMCLIGSHIDNKFVSEICF